MMVNRTAGVFSTMFVPHNKNDHKPTTLVLNVSFKPKPRHHIHVTDYVLSETQQIARFGRAQQDYFRGKVTS
jgi:hypothetical protein